MEEKFGIKTKSYMLKELKEKLSGRPNIVLTNYKGLNTQALESLRRKLADTVEPQPILGQSPQIRQRHVIGVSRRRRTPGHTHQLNLMQRRPRSSRAQAPSGTTRKEPSQPASQNHRSNLPR